MVSCTNPVAAAAGMATLENGGNAFDAAVSAGLVLQIVDPERCGPGGEAVIIFKAAQDDGPRVLCGQGTAPADARPDRYKDLGLNVVPGTGLLAAPVPGAFDAWMKLLLDFGTKNLREVFQYAIGYAESGFPLTPWTSSKIRQMEQIFRQDWPSSAQVYLDQDSAPFALFTNKAIARTYQRILGEAMSSNASREGQINAARRAWYHGFIAEAVDKFVKQRHRDSSGMEHSGLITAEDFAAFESCYEDPICLEWRNWKIYKAGPWSTGPVFLQQLKLIDSFGDPTGVLNTPEFIHTFTEAAKLAYADRDAFYGDRHDVPLSILLSSEYTDARHRLIEPEASMELRPGSPGGKVPLMSPRGVPASSDTWRYCSSGRGGSIRECRISDTQWRIPH
jgi:gamma-glutamyltranspeptidase/glutathione hydrolase